MMSQACFGLGFLFVFKTAEVLCFHRFLIMFGSIPCESSDERGRKYIIAPCSVSLFDAS